MTDHNERTEGHAGRGRDLALLAATAGQILLVAFAALWMAGRLNRMVEASGRLEIFGYLFATQEPAAAWLSLLLLAVGILAALFLPGSWSRRVPGWLTERRWLIASLVFVVLAAGTQVVYRNFPLSMDEYTMLFQAEAFAAGKLGGQFPPPLVPFLIPPWFVGYFFDVAPDGTVLGVYWPGFSLLLTPFAWLGTPWLLNPLLAAGCVLLVWKVSAEIGGQAAAGWAVLLAIASPEFLTNGLSYYSMTAHLFFNLLFVWLLMRPGLLAVFAAGFVGSIALVLHQPLSHALFALPWIAWLAASRARWPRLVALGLGYLPLCLVIGLGWPWLRAEVTEAATPREAIAVESVTVSGEAEDGGELERIAGAFAMPDRNVLEARFLGLLKLALWAVPGLPLLAWLGWRGRRGVESRGSPWIGLLAASAVVSLAGYLFVPFSQGHGWGFRYFHHAWAVLPILGGVALATLGTSSPRWKRLILVLALGSLLCATTMRFWQVRSFIDRQLGQLPPTWSQPSEEGERWVLFLDITRGFYSADLVRNDPFLRDPRLVLISQGREVDERVVGGLLTHPELVSEFQGQTLWRAEADR